MFRKFLEVYKKDLGEFASTLKDEAKPLTNIFSSFFSGKEDEKNPVHVQKSSVVSELPKTKTKTKTFELAPGVFTEEFTTDEIQRAKQFEIEEFENWGKSEDGKVDTEERTKEISDLLKENEEINKVMSTQVPEKIKYEVFWGRYFYRKLLFEKEAEKRERLDKIKSMEEDLSWAEDDDFDVPQSKEIVAKDEGKQVEDVLTTVKLQKEEIVKLTERLKLETKKYQDLRNAVIKLVTEENAEKEYTVFELKQYFSENCFGIFEKNDEETPQKIEEPKDVSLQKKEENVKEDSVEKKAVEKKDEVQDGYVDNEKKEKEVGNLPKDDDEDYEDWG